MRSTLRSSVTTAGQPCRGAVPPKIPQGRGWGALPHAGGLTPGHPEAAPAPREAGGTPNDAVELSSSQEPAPTCLGFKAFSYLLWQLGLVVKSPHWRCYQPGFMASVVSLSWLQLGKRWRGMKGAAMGGMSGEHFKGSRDTESH